MKVVPILSLAFAAAASVAVALAQENSLQQTVLGGSDRAVFEGNFAKNLELLSTTVGRARYDGIVTAPRTPKIILGATTIVCPSSAVKCVVEATISVRTSGFAETAATLRLCFKLDGKYMQPNTGGCAIVGESPSIEAPSTQTATAIQFNVKPGRHEIAPWIQSTDDTFKVYSATATYRVYK